MTYRLRFVDVGSGFDEQAEGVGFVEAGGVVRGRPSELRHAKKTNDRTTTPSVSGEGGAWESDLALWRAVATGRRGKRPSRSVGGARDKKVVRREANRRSGTNMPRRREKLTKSTALRSTPFAAMSRATTSVRPFQQAVVNGVIFHCAEEEEKQEEETKE